MKRLRLAVLIGLIGLMGLGVFGGCNAFSPQRQRQRIYSIKTDLDRMVDDVDWILGLHRPSTLYNESMR
jgi:hypothetical protein